MVWRTKQQSAGILVYRRSPEGIAVLLAHPGGPIFRRRDAGVWTIPKGEIDPGEEPLGAARRELNEETGLSVNGPFVALGSVKQKSGKVVHAWAVEADFEVTRLTSTNFTMEWPPRSGRQGEFPEVDRAEYFSIEVARTKLIPAQAEFLDRLLAALGASA